MYDTKLIQEIKDYFDNSTEEKINSDYEEIKEYSMPPTMTQTEAIKQMKFGKKIAHRYYLPGEYIYMGKDKKLYTNEGHILNWIVYTTNSAFYDGWYVYGLINYAVTGTFHGSIVSASSEGEARRIFHRHYNGESIIHIKITNY